MRYPLTASTALLYTIYVSASPLDVRAVSICGKAGYDKSESFYGSSAGTYFGCAAECSKKKCSSFAYGQGECQLYSCSVRDNLVPINDSPYLFYDAACITSSTTAIKSTTSTASIKTTTTKSTTTTTTATTKLTTKPTTTTTTSAKTTITTTKKTITTTTTAATTTTAGSLVCGQQGYMQGSSGFHGYQTSYDTPTQEALNECYNDCLTNEESYCTAWNWYPNSCVLYSYAVDGHFQSSPGDSYIWDRRCGAPVAP